MSQVIKYRPSIDSSSGKDDNLRYIFPYSQWFESHAIHFIFALFLLFIIKIHTSLFSIETCFIYLFTSFVNFWCQILKVEIEAVFLRC